jgi:hypothetical protein
MLKYAGGPNMSTHVRRIEAGRVRGLAVALVVSMIGLVGCSNADGGDTDDGPVAVPAVTSPSSVATSAAPDVDGDSDATVLNGRSILILDQVTGINGGKVRRGSFIGDSPFCPGGSMRHEHGRPGVGTGIATFRCRDGSLSIGFTPLPAPGLIQSSPWKVVSGTGSYKGIRGQGWMVVRFEGGSSEKGEETFVGTITR